MADIKVEHVSAHASHHSGFWQVTRDGAVLAKFLAADTARTDAYDYAAQLTVERNAAVAEPLRSIINQFSAGVPAEDEGYPPPCTDPGGHSWVTADKDEHGDGRSYCEWCGVCGDL